MSLGHLPSITHNNVNSLADLPFGTQGDVQNEVGKAIYNCKALRIAS